MTDQGFIAVHRKIKDSAIWSDSQAVHLFIHLLLKANHKDNEFVQNGALVKVKRGQFVTGRRRLSDETGISESKIQRLLSLFESLNMIEQQTNSKNRLVSITNWSKYQIGEQQTNSKRTASEQQVNTDNNDNNEDNDNKLLAQPDKSASLVGQLQTNTGELFPVYQDDIDMWSSTYPAVNVIAEMKRIHAWLDANPTKRKTARGMKRFVNSWLSRQQDKPSQPATNNSIDDVIRSGVNF